MQNKTSSPTILILIQGKHMSDFKDVEKYPLMVGYFSAIFLII